MLLRLLSISLPVLLLAFVLPNDENRYPKDFFAAPVSGQLRLSGTFGELRPDHFHSGIDIKGGLGVPIYAAGDGEVYCIKINPGGYGSVMYIRHPNGYTTLYAHLSGFSPELARFIEEKQYAAQLFTVELYPEPGQFPVKKGQLVAKMGNTGHSFGPHLHFEIRETATDRSINPLLFGLQVIDNTPPRVHELKLYQLGENQQLAETRRVPLLIKNGQYGVTGDTLKVKTKQVGLAIKAYDHMDGVNNWNGIYTIELFVDDRRVYQFATEKLDFTETRYINAHVDYEERVSRNSYFHRCFLLPGNALSMYEQVQESGKIVIADKQVRKINIAIKDVAGNTARTQFWLKLDTALVTAAARQYNYLLPYNQPSVINSNDIKLQFPEGTFYEDCYMQYSVVPERSANVFSKVHTLHHTRVPVHRFYTMALKPVNLPDSLRGKAFVAYCNSNGKVTNYGGKWQPDGLLKAEVRTLGEFCIKVDTVPPTITPERFSPVLSKVSSVSFRIRDNFGAAGTVAGLNYRAEIDGQWVLMDYDQKYDRITYRFTPRVVPGSHVFHLEVWDGMGNKRVWDKNFTR
ncbi:M23 family metallopeptidase [Haliscomenobacter hydrossis]|uniref:Peptidase M23 n=1 Tax=Haliscomenobacter hydrossis (strain ATCC 27775 / DSM 1100 / LMG 10767 / O) TaxID=760192 RepID=F4L6N5_HALH1|nr:M23 family metallopeptidase [Haliscomenobacter hydrossis]AEE50866.1 Peptidase M23 [Haliscomenobacter hydrossis DSM 1100]